jgi:hypothetical protein
MNCDSLFEWQSRVNMKRTAISNSVAYLKNAYIKQRPESNFDYELGQGFHSSMIPLDCCPSSLLGHYLAFGSDHLQGSINWRVRLSTVDLLVLPSLGPQLFLFDILFMFLTKQSTLMRRSTVLTHPLWLVFLAISFHDWPKVTCQGLMFAEKG